MKCPDSVLFLVVLGGASPKMLQEVARELRSNQSMQLEDGEESIVTLKTIGGGEKSGCVRAQGILKRFLSSSLFQYTLKH